MVLLIAGCPFEPLEPEGARDAAGCAWEGAGADARLVYTRADVPPDIVRESWALTSAAGRPPRLVGVRRGSTLERCTLRNGDLLRTVNGAPVSDLSSFYAAFQTIATVEGPHTIEVNRRDAVAHITIVTR